MKNVKCLALRNALGYSQQQLAIMAKISPATIVAIEKYGYMPGAWVRKKLARALKVPETSVWPELNRRREASRQWK